mgnify:CR=1 FL=1
MNMTYTLEQIEEACQKATPGPWSKIMRKEDRLFVGTEKKPVADVCNLYGAESEANLQLISLARTSLPELVARVRELEEGWHKFISGEAGHQEKVCIAECHERKHGYCYDMRKCEEILDPVELAKIAMMQIKLKELEAENAALRKAVFKFAGELCDLADQILTATDQNEGGANND